MPQRFDPQEVKARGRNRWAEILSTVAGLPAASLDGQHHPCPRCGGTDRFRFTDLGGDGSIICNACARRQCGDGLAAVQWALGVDFGAALAAVAEYLGVQPSAGGPPPRAARSKPGSNGKHHGHDPHGSAPHGPAVDPGKDLSPIPWSDGLASYFCSRKPPIVPGAIVAAGGLFARYRRAFTVVDLPIIGHGGAVTGHCLYNATGGTLPRFDLTGRIVEQVKIKITYGSQPGLIGTVAKLAAATTVWKVEGPSDALTLLSCPDLPADVAVITNSSGAGEKPAAWILESLAGKTVFVVGDADQPGEEGAAFWAGQIAREAKECRQVRLPFEVAETHGKDLRDWMREVEG